MEIVYKNQTEVFKNSDVCTAVEYSMKDKDINGAVVKTEGRYPEKERVVNLKCKELVYVMEGSGEIVVEKENVKLKKGDLVLINSKERYFFDGDMIMFISCTPAWYVEQHKKVT